MNCQQSYELFPDYLGKEITKEQSTELAAHLKICENCREELISLSGIPSLLRNGWPDEEIPSSLIFETPRSSWRQFVNVFFAPFLASRSDCQRRGHDLLHSLYWHLSDVEN